MKIKSKPAVKTVTAKKTRTAVKKAAPKAAAKPVEKSVTFTVHAEPGKAVYLAGSFNNWDPAGKKMLEKKGNGVYTVAIKLVPGTYQYKFVIDGTWCADPENRDFVQNDHGTLNSVITHVWASQPTTVSGETPAARNAARRVSPWRFARRRPSGPTTSGTWQ